MSPARSDLYHDSRYRCCCSACHSTTGSTLIGGLQMCAVVGYLLHLTMGEGPPPVYFENTGKVVGAIISILVITLIVLVHVYGVFLRHPIWIIPFMVLQIFLTIALLVVALILAVQLGGTPPGSRSVAESSEPITAAAPIETTSSNSATTESIGKYSRRENFYWRLGYLVACVIGSIMHLWFFIVALSAYRYARAMNATPKSIQTRYSIQLRDIG